MKHHQLIRALVKEIRDLREQVQYANDANYAAECAEANYKKQLRNAEYERQEAESAASYRKWEHDSAVSALEKARRYGNEHEEEKALRRLKSL